MDKLLKMWFSNQLEHLEGLEIKGKVIVSKNIVSDALLHSKDEDSEEDLSEEQEANALNANDYNNILNHLKLRTFQLSLNEEKVVIKLDVKR